MTTPDQYIAQIDACCQQARAAVIEASQHRMLAQQALREARPFDDHFDAFQKAIDYANEQIAIGVQVQAQLEAEFPSQHSHHLLMNVLETEPFDQEEKRMTDRYSPEYLDPRRDEYEPVCLKGHHERVDDCLSCSQIDFTLKGPPPVTQLAETVRDATDALLEFSNHRKESRAEKVGQAFWAIILLSLAIGIGIIVIAWAGRIALSVVGANVQ